MNKQTRDWSILAVALGAAALLAYRAYASHFSATRVTIVGDSLAVGLTPRLSDLASGSGRTLTSHAVVGTRVTYWTPQIDQILSEDRPDLLLVSLGTNDAMLPNTKEFEQGVDQLLASAKRAGVKVLWILPPTMPERVALQDAVRAVVRAKADHYFDSTTLDIPRGGDGIHPTPQGAALWADALWKRLFG